MSNSTDAQASERDERLSSASEIDPSEIDPSKIEPSEIDPSEIDLFAADPFDGDPFDTEPAGIGSTGTDSANCGPTDQIRLDKQRAGEVEHDVRALQARQDRAEYREATSQFRKAFPRRRQPGGNDLERQRYLMAQQRLRWFARRGITLEIDDDGLPMPHASGTEARLPTDPWSLPSSMPTLKVRDPETLGQIIRLWRRRTNESIAQLALDSEQTTRFIAKLERGESQSALVKILRVTDALEMEVLIRPRRSSLRA